MTDVPSIDPRTGRIVEIVATETTTDEVDQLARQALTAAGPLDRMGRDGRASLLGHLAHALEGGRDRIVTTADRETGLGPSRLGGELTRTIYQLQLFADVLRDGGYLEATIDLLTDAEYPDEVRPEGR